MTNTDEILKQDEAADQESTGRVTAVRRAGVTEFLNADALSRAHSSTDLDQLTLHEERATVQAVRERAGTVTIRKVLKERQEMIPVTLTTETLEITVTDGNGLVTLNGETLEPGRTYELTVRDEKAVIEKQVYATSDVRLTKQTHAFTHTEEVTLRREFLEVSDPQGLVREVEVTEGKSPS